MVYYYYYNSNIILITLCIIGNDFDYLFLYYFQLTFHIFIVLHVIVLYLIFNIFSIQPNP